MDGGRWKEVCLFYTSVRKESKVRTYVPLLHTVRNLILASAFPFLARDGCARPPPSVSPPLSLTFQLYLFPPQPPSLIPASESLGE